MVLPKTSTNNNTQPNTIVAGWNEYVREHKDEALYRHQIWLDNGRPSQGEIAFNRRRTRAKYNYAIRFVNKEKNRIIINTLWLLIELYDIHYSTLFWCTIV